jgi:hypothetical protein
MNKVCPQPQLVSAFTVHCGNYGDVRRYAEQRGVSRQWVYREAAHVLATLDERPAQAESARLQQRVRDLEHQLQELQDQLAQAVLLDADKQAEFASVGQAKGVSLPDCYDLLDVLTPGRILSVATLGRRTQAAGQQASRLLPVFDAYARDKARQGAGDEIYVRAPVLMLVEQESLCWLSGRLVDEVKGDVWAEELRHLPHLEQLTRDGGKALAKGVALVNAERQQQRQQPPAATAVVEPLAAPPVGTGGAVPPPPTATVVVDQADHYHGLRGSGPGLRKCAQKAQKTLAEAEAAQKALEECRRQGQKQTGPSARARAAWRRAEQAMDTWSERERVWQQTQAALCLITPEGELNTRARATAVLAATLPQLPDSDFAKVKRQVQQPEMLNYLDHVQAQLAALPYAAEVTAAAVRQEALRRRPELLQGAGARAGALRGVLLACAVVLSKVGAAGEGVEAAVRDILRRAYRASSLVECINSVLRMQQARHRKLTQGLLDLKRLYWNGHEFRTGRRRGTSPYRRLGVPWPKGMRWWEVLKLTPEQLRAKLSTALQDA